MKHPLPVWFLLAALLAVALPARAADPAPRIAGIESRDGKLWVSVDVPEGTRRLTLETRSRLGRGTWTPQKVEWLDGTAGIREWALDVTGDSVLVRVRREADSDLPLPAGFYAGPTDFAPETTTNAAPPDAFFGPVDAVAGGEDRGGETAREVAESDIWRLDGNTLYFFNSVRGLQVIDLEEPDSPALVATLPLAGRGEQMYLLPGSPGEGRWLALLTQDDCGGTSSTVRLVHHSGATLTPGAALPVIGGIRESRLVGTALYLASADSYARPMQTTTNELGVVSVIAAEWRTDTVVTSFDLSDPTVPVDGAVLRLPASPDAIAATPEALWVAVTERDDSNPETPWYLRTQTRRVHRFDITDPAGAVVPAGSVVVRGRVADKFKLHQDGDILTVVSQQDGLWRPAGDPSLGWVFFPAKTWLETFRWQGGAGTALGVVKLVENESLFATRFIGKRAYVVTFRQIDPLWIVDLSDPARPEIKGELQIPGYSSYLEPLGTDRLLAMGVEAGNATVALFDVSDDSNPRQITKVFLGSGWSWSEANSDEKAFRVLPDQQLALVPWQGYDGERWTQAVQLIDFTPDTLALRGVIRHAMQPRRATVVRDRIVSVSSRELLAVDFADRDNPAVTASLGLGFRVDRVARLGDRLVEVAYDADLFGGTGFAPELRLAPASAPEAATGRIDLPQGQVVGLAVRGSIAHVLQFEGDTWRTEERIDWKEEEGGTDDVSDRTRVAVTNQVSVLVPGRLHASLVDCTGPVPTRVGSVSLARPTNYWGSAMSAFFPSDATVVWTETGGGTSGYPWWYWGPMTDAAVGIRPAFGIWWPGIQGNRHLIALDIAEPGDPVVASVTPFENNGSIHSFSAVAQAGTRLHFSHRHSVWKNPDPEGDRVIDDAALWIAPPGSWQPEIYETRFLLDVVDLADPYEPVIRPPAPLPGDLLGVAVDGALLLAAGDARWDTNGIPTRPLHGIAYDGVTPNRVALLEEPGIESWHMAEGARVVGFRRGRPDDGNGTPSALQPWHLSAGGDWESEPSAPLAPDTYEVHRFEDLWVTAGGRLFEFHRLPVDAAFSRLGEAGRACSWWFNWDHADGSADDGLWIPLGEYGLQHLMPVP